MAPPQLRGLLRKQIMRDLATGFTLSFVGASVWWFGLARPQCMSYVDFYSNYDAKAVAASMTASFERKGGI